MKQIKTNNKKERKKTARASHHLKRTDLGKMRFVCQCLTE